MNPEPLLRATHQEYKIRNMIIVFLSGLALLGLAWLLIELKVTSDFVGVLMVLGLLLIPCSLLYAFYAVRCPHCRLSWFRWALGHQPSDQWIVWLKSFSVCPRCGYTSSRAPNDLSAT